MKMESLYPNASPEKRKEKLLSEWRVIDNKFGDKH